MVKPVGGGTQNAGNFNQAFYRVKVVNWYWARTQRECPTPTLEATGGSRVGALGSRQGSNSHIIVSRVRGVVLPGA